MNDNDYTVLVVDDEEAVLGLMATHLSDLPYTIIPTSSPAEAIHILKNREIAVLLCDLNLNMPNMDGNTILAVARESNSDIVSILISGISDQESMIQAINEGGIWKFLSKPWDKQDLIALVAAAVDHYARTGEQDGQLKSLARNVTRLQTEQMGGTRKRIRVVHKVSPLIKAKYLIESGTLLANRYELGEEIGEGGIGKVFKAQDMMLQMTVAVKVLFPEFSDDDVAITTLKEEARIAMQLSHRHIVRLHNLQKVHGYYYLVMEYVEGKTFREILELSGRLTMDSVAQIIRVSSDALSYAHRHGVIHKDLKPDNILLTDDGVLKIIDFGIACLAKTQDSSSPIIGTPSYMSPEHIRGATLDVRTDIYALGIMAYEFLSGKQPFPANLSLLEMLDMMPPKLDSPVVPSDVAAVLEKATAFRRSNRWESVPAFATALIDALNVAEQKKAS
ncbi:MAG: protein kinase [Kiritimatiellae bacterium]|nr:protein kinase [Kiritimatiellia bacterium]